MSILGATLGLLLHFSMALVGSALMYLAFAGGRKSHVYDNVLLGTIDNLMNGMAMGLWLASLLWCGSQPSLT